MKHLILTWMLLATLFTSLHGQTEGSKWFIGFQKGLAVFTEQGREVAKRGINTRAYVGYQLDERFSAGLSTHLYMTVRDLPEFFLTDLNLFLGSDISLSGWYSFRSAWCKPYLSASVGPSRMIFSSAKLGSVSRLNLSYQGQIGIIVNKITIAYGITRLGRIPQGVRSVPENHPLTLAYHNVLVGYTLNY